MPSETGDAETGYDFLFHLVARAAALAAAPYPTRTRRITTARSAALTP